MGDQNQTKLSSRSQSLRLYELALNYYQDRFDDYEVKYKREYKRGRILGFGGITEEEVKEKAHQKAKEDTLGLFKDLF